MWFLVIICPHDYRNKSSLALESTNRKPQCCLVFSGDGSFPKGKRGYSFSGLIPRILCFTGAIFVDSNSSIALRGETVFANNTADFGDKTLKCTL